MPVYQTSQQLSGVLQALFDRVARDPSAARALSDSRLIIRLQTSQPAAAVWLNGRKAPPQLSYGETHLKPDLDILTSSDVLHQILLGKQRLTVAMANNQLHVRGPVWRSLVLQDIFRTAQAFYPVVLAERGGPPGAPPPAR
ncbi:MAG: hypothetical protein ACKOC5_07245 [Chloroflexota bacterium]